MATVVVFTPGWEQKYDDAVHSNLLVPVAEAVLDDAKRHCPVDSGDLKDSLGIVYTSSGARIGSPLSYAAATELGSGPHIIRSKGPYSLSDGHGNYFGRVVHHPGTPAQPYLRPALFKKRSF